MLEPLWYKKCARNEKKRMDSGSATGWFDTTDTVLRASLNSQLKMFDIHRRVFVALAPDFLITCPTPNLVFFILPPE